VRKYVLGFGLMHYKTQVPCGKFGASAGESAKDFEYIWKSRNVNLLTIRPTSAEIVWPHHSGKFQLLRDYVQSTSRPKPVLDIKPQAQT
jgi:hypothetical protein